MPSNKLMIEFNEQLDKLLQNTPLIHMGIAEQLTQNKGKQLRPRLSLLCAELVGQPNEKSYRAALVAEMIHLASLLHDDVIDCSNERRGSPSINSIWGNKIAILSGDIISMTSLNLILKNKDLDLYKIYANATKKLVAGELTQLKRLIIKKPKENDYYKIIEGKTASLFEAACKAGASSTSDNLKQINTLGVFGKNLGMAYQLKDDLFAYENYDIGKPIYNDFKERRLTLPLIYTLNEINCWQRFKLIVAIKMRRMNQQNLNNIIDKVKKTGGIIYATIKMDNYMEKAIKSLKTFPKSNLRDEIEDLAISTLNRNT
jgi:octaprenyl-diphosphate synthase